jgi:hypothetical protein
LYEVSGGDTTEVDTYTYANFEVVDDRATGRALDGSEWQVFDALNPYSGDTPPLGNGCVPTPGAPNECSAVLPVEDSTWGAVKEMYR